jgi:hypothetical protein
LVQITTIFSFFIAKITYKTHWRVSILVHRSSVSNRIMALSFLFYKFLIIFRIRPSSLSFGILFTSVFSKTSQQNLSRPDQMQITCAC